MNKVRTFAAGALAAGLISILGMGCELVASVDHTALEGTGGNGIGGGGGAGGAPGCVDAAVDCPAPESECMVATCDAGVCGTALVDEGTPTTTQTAADCQVAQCDAAGEVVNVPDDADVGDDNNECTDNLCDNGATSFPNKAIGTACTGGNVCVTGMCVPPTCTDTVIGGDETDADCGGSCPPCADGLDCSVAADCESGVCTGSVCQTPTCSDTVPNGNETDIDCGGIDCDPCDDGLGCGVGTDCTSGVCNPADNTCLGAACSDTVMNGDETDTDCGGSCLPCIIGDKCMIPGDCQSNFCDGTATCAACAGAGDCAANEYCKVGTCTPDEADGVACTVGGDCTSTFCTDGVCCNSACTGTLCQACTATLKGGGADGVCGPIGSGLDPQAECAAATCKTGACDGNSACGNSSNATTCGSSPSCSNGIQTNQDLCSGTGTCTDNGTTSCGNFICGATACKTICANDNDCTSGNYCNVGNACVAKGTNGDACSAANQCNSGFCTDGVCCGTACNGGSCDACSIAAGGTVNGTCSIFTSGATGNPSCTPFVCGGAAACPTTCVSNANCAAGFVCGPANTCIAPQANGATCGNSGQCSSANCIDGFCCNNSCGGLCQACNVTGLNGTCSPIITGNDPANECSAGTCLTGACNGAGACGFSSNVTTCGTALSCTNSVLTAQDFCAGNSATCTDNGTTSCGNYACNAGGTACKTTCTTSADCNAAVADCHLGSSTCRLLAGQPCTANSTTECFGGNCPAMAPLVCP